MVKLVFLHLSDYAFLLENGTPGIVGIFVKLRASKLPAIRNNIGAVAKFSFGEEIKSCSVMMKIFSPDGEVVAESSEAKIGPSSGKELGFVTNIPSVKMEKDGTYTAEIYVDSKKIGEECFTLEIANPK